MAESLIRKVISEELLKEIAVGVNSYHERECELLGEYLLYLQKSHSSLKWMHITIMCTNESLGGYAYNVKCETLSDANYVRDILTPKLLFEIVRTDNCLCICPEHLLSQGITSDRHDCDTLNTLLNKIEQEIENGFTDVTDTIASKFDIVSGLLKTRQINSTQDLDELLAFEDTFRFEIGKGRHISMRWAAMNTLEFVVCVIENGDFQTLQLSLSLLGDLNLFPIPGPPEQSLLLFTWQMFQKSSEDGVALCLQLLLSVGARHLESERDSMSRDEVIESLRKRRLSDPIDVTEASSDVSADKLLRTFTSELNNVKMKFDEIMRRICSTGFDITTDWMKEVVFEKKLTKIAEVLVSELFLDFVYVAHDIVGPDDTLCSALRCGKKSEHGIVCNRILSKRPEGQWGKWTCDWEHPSHDRTKSFNRTDFVYGCHTIMKCDWGICRQCYQKILFQTKVYNTLNIFSRFLQYQIRCFLREIVNASHLIQTTTSYHDKIDILLRIPVVRSLLTAKLNVLPLLDKLISFGPAINSLIFSGEEDQFISEMVFECIGLVKFDLFPVSDIITSYFEDFDSAAKEVNSTMKDVADRILPKYFLSNTMRRANHDQQPGDSISTYVHDEMAASSASVNYKFSSHICHNHLYASLISSLVGVVISNSTVPEWVTNTVIQNWFALTSSLLLRLMNAVVKKLSVIAKLTMKLSFAISEIALPPWIAPKPLNLKLDKHHFCLSNALALSKVISLIQSSPPVIHFVASKYWNFSSIQLIVTPVFRVLVLQSDDTMVVCVDLQIADRDWAAFFEGGNNLTEFATESEDCTISVSLQVHKQLKISVDEIWHSESDTENVGQRKYLREICSTWINKHKSKRVFVCGYGFGGSAAAMLYPKVEQLVAAANTKLATFVPAAISNNGDEENSASAIEDATSVVAVDCGAAPAVEASSKDSTLEQNLSSEASSIITSSNPLETMDISTTIDESMSDQHTTIEHAGAQVDKLKTDCDSMIKPSEDDADNKLPPNLSFENSKATNVSIASVQVFTYGQLPWCSSQCPVDELKNFLNIFSVNMRNDAVANYLENFELVSVGGLYVLGNDKLYISRARDTSSLSSQVEDICKLIMLSDCKACPRVPPFTHFMAAAVVCTDDNLRHPDTYYDLLKGVRSAVFDGVAFEIMDDSDVNIAELELTREILIVDGACRQFETAQAFSSSTEEARLIIENMGFEKNMLRNQPLIDSDDMVLLGKLLKIEKFFVSQTNAASLQLDVTNEIRVAMAEDADYNASSKADSLSNNLNESSSETTVAATIALSNMNPMNALRFAIEEDDVATAKELLCNAEVIEKINDTEEFGDTILMLCTNRYRCKIAYLLFCHFCSTEGCLHNSMGRCQLRFLNVNILDSSLASALYYAIARGFIEIIRILLLADNIDMNSPPNTERCPIACCVRADYPDIFKLLHSTGKLNLGWQLESSEYSGMDLLQYSIVVESEEMFQVLYDTKLFDINRKITALGVFPLLQALVCLMSKKGLTKVFDILVSDPDIDVNQEMVDGRPVIRIALERNEFQAVEKLANHPKIKLDLEWMKELDNEAFSLQFLTLFFSVPRARLVELVGDSVNVTSSTGLTLLMASILHIGNFLDLVVRIVKGSSITEMVLELLTSHSLNVNAVDSSSHRTALHFAAQGGHTSIILALLKIPNIDVNAADNVGETPLADAVRGLHFECVRVLLDDERVNVNASVTLGKLGKTTVLGLCLILKNTSSQILDALLSHPRIQLVSVVDAETMNNEMHLASIGDHSNAVRVFRSDTSVDINAKNETGSTALLLACKAGNCEVVKVLLESLTVDVNMANSSGETPLFAALVAEKADCAELLLLDSNHVVNINYCISVAEGFEVDAFSIACKTGQTAIVSLMLSYPDIKISPKGLYDAMALACVTDNVDVVRKIIDDHGYTVEMINTSQPNVWLLAADRCSTEVVKLLLTYSVDINVVDVNNITALRVCIVNRYTELALLLLAHPGIDIFAKDNHKRSYLHLACVAGLDRVVSVLIPYIAASDVNAVEEKENTPLFLACLSLFPDVVRELLTHPLINVNFEDQWHNSALSLAVERNQIDIVRMLVSRSDIKINGTRAIHEAVDAGYCDILDELLKNDTIDVNDTDHNTQKFVENYAQQIGVTEDSKVDGSLLQMLRSKVYDIGLTPLYIASYRGHAKCVERLLKHPRIDMHLPRRNAPILIAKKLEHVDVLLAFLQHKTLDLDTENDILSYFSTNLDIQGKLYFGAAIAAVGSGRLHTALEKFQMCCELYPYDFQVCSSFVALSLYLEKIDVEELDISSEISPKIQFCNAMVLYHYEQFELALRIVIDLRSKVVHNGILMLQSLLYFHCKKYYQAYVTCCSIDYSTNKEFTSYLQIQMYLYGLLFLALEQIQRAYYMFSELVKIQTFLNEPYIYISQILYSIGQIDQAELLCKKLNAVANILPLYEKNILVKLAQKIEVDKYMKSASARMATFNMLSSVLDTELQQMKSPHEIPFRKVLLSFDLAAAKKLLLEYNSVLLPQYGTGHANYFAQFCDSLLPAYQLLDAGSIIPLVTLMKRTTRLSRVLRLKKKPVVMPREYSASFATLELNGFHPMFSRILTTVDEINELQTEYEILALTVEENLLKQKSALANQFKAKALTDLEHDFINERSKVFSDMIDQIGACNCIKFALHGLKLYYIHYIDYFLRHEADNRPNNLEGEDKVKYLCQLHDQINQKSPIFEEEKDGKPLSELVRVIIEEENTQSPTPDVVYLQGFENPDPNDRLWYRLLSLTRPQTTEENGMHAVVQKDGVHYKYRPYAVGVEYAVNSLNQHISADICLPTRIIKIEGCSGGNYDQVAYYLASSSIEGTSLHKVLNNGNFLEKLDIESFSALFVSSLLVGTGDAKPDNFMVRSVSAADGKSKSFKLMSIDNDISFCKGRLGFRRFAKGKARLFSDVLNVLFLFPQMDFPIHSSVAAKLVAAYSPERITCAWLHDLHKRNLIYESLRHRGFCENDFKALKIPIKLPIHTAIDVYERLKQMKQIAMEDSNTTHTAILQSFYPGMAAYYWYKRVGMKKGEEVTAIQQMYLEACEDEKLREDLANKDKAKSTQKAWSSVASSRMMDEQKFANHFRHSVQDLAKDLLQSFDFSLIDAASCRTIGEELSFLDSWTLINPTPQHIEEMLFKWEDKPPGSYSTKRITIKGENIMNRFRSRTNSVLERKSTKLGIEFELCELDVPEQEEVLLGSAGAIKLGPELQTLNASGLEDISSALEDFLEKSINGKFLRLAAKAEAMNALRGIIRNASPVAINSFLQIPAHQDICIPGYAPPDGISAPVENLLNKFSHLLLDYPDLWPIAKEFADRGCFAQDKFLIHRLVILPNVAVYSELLKSLVRTTPDILLNAEYSTNMLPCDRIKRLTRINNTKYSLLCSLINAMGAAYFIMDMNMLVNSTQLTNESSAMMAKLSYVYFRYRVLTQFDSPEEELIVRSAIFCRIPCDEAECAALEFNFNKVHPITKNNIFHQCVVNIMEAYESLPVHLFKQAYRANIETIKLAFEVLSHRVSNRHPRTTYKIAMDYIWTHTNGFTLWGLCTKHKKHVRPLEILDEIYNKWEGKSRVLREYQTSADGTNINPLFPLHLLSTGEHRLTIPHTDINKVSRLFFMCRWYFPIHAVHCGVLNSFHGIILNIDSPPDNFAYSDLSLEDLSGSNLSLKADKELANLLNSQSKMTGNTLLHEIINTTDQEIRNTTGFENRREAIVFLLTKGIDPNVRNKNGITAIELCAKSKQESLLKLFPNGDLPWHRIPSEDKLLGWQVAVKKNQWQNSELFRDTMNFLLDYRYDPKYQYELVDFVASFTLSCTQYSDVADIFSRLWDQILLRPPSDVIELSSSRLLLIFHIFRKISEHNLPSEIIAVHERLQTLLSGVVDLPCSIADSTCVVKVQELMLMLNNMIAKDARSFIPHIDSLVQIIITGNFPAQFQRQSTGMIFLILNSHHRAISDTQRRDVVVPVPGRPGEQQDIFLQLFVDRYNLATERQNKFNALRSFYPMYAGPFMESLFQQSIDTPSCQINIKAMFAHDRIRDSFAQYYIPINQYLMTIVQVKDLNASSNDISLSPSYVIVIVESRNAFGFVNIQSWNYCLSKNPTIQISSIVDFEREVRNWRPTQRANYNRDIQSRLEADANVREVVLRTPNQFSESLELANCVVNPKMKYFQK